MSSSNSDNGNGTVRVKFTHPREGKKTLEVDLAPAINAEQAIAELVRASFISPAGEGRGYTLQHARTSRNIPPSSSLETAGVRDGDVIGVVLVEEGH
jgi:hypothetical protein